MYLFTIGGVTFNVFGVILGLCAIGFLVALFIAQRHKRLDWLDLLTRDGTKVSTTKVLQLVGGAVGTWAVIKMTLTDKLTWDMFMIYLTYVASVDGFSKFIMAKYGAEGSDDSTEPYKRIKPPEEK